jgi:hypothetical protein
MIGNPMTYNPAQVMMGYSGSGPYLPTGPDENKGKGPPTDQGPAQQPGQQMFGGPAQLTVGQPSRPQPGNVLQSESVRASGTGPFDQAYRQNLATYAGGQLQRPGGNLSFNPTGTDFPSGPSLLEQALGGQAFSTPPPAAQAAAPLSWQDWLKRFRGQGRMFDGGWGAREMM